MTRFEPGEIQRREQVALEDEFRKGILMLIGLDLVRMRDLEKKLKMKEQDLKNHLAMLERAMLIEQEEECYRLTPRCIAYLDQLEGYEWRR